jgi:aryl-alcohol dehydrogenase-like predicted oxidoreductase
LLADFAHSIARRSFGSWVTFAGQVDTKLAYNLMKQAYEAGINFFDNAEACSI